jgi:CrcB protein
VTGYLLVFLGGGIGAALRHGVNRASLALLGPSLPAGTLLVNVIGSFLMGLLAGWFLQRGGTESARLFLATGILGGFTTFSALSLDAVLLWQRGDHALAAVYVTASVALSIGGLLAGFAAMRAFSAAAL